MALTDKKLAKLKSDYESGKFTKANICKKHHVSRPTLWKQAKDNGWVWQKNLTQLNKQIEQKTNDNIVKKYSDHATKITEQFLADIDEYRKLTLYPAAEIEREMDRLGIDGKISKDEYDRIFSGAKIYKICLEALNVGYTGARKALGMDKEEHKTNIELTLNALSDEELIRIANEKE